MNYTYFIGSLMCFLIFIPAALRTYSKRMHRRLARRLASGSVGALLKHEYNYAMELSQMVSEGDLSVADVTVMADNWLLRNTDSGVLPGVTINRGQAHGF